MFSEDLPLALWFSRFFEHMLCVKNSGIYIKSVAIGNFLINTMTTTKASASYSTEYYSL
jgi:hypothetical protein